MEEYQYKNLPLHSSSIRVLHLLPSVDDSVIRCKLVVYPLQEAKEVTYQAISYCWGDANDKLEIYVDDKVLRVNRNLCAALRRLRSSNEVRLLWSDSVCINQEDKKEKASQVQMMRQIYEHASSTLVWLGPGDSLTPWGFELIPRLIEAGKLREANGDERRLTHLTAEERKTYGLPSQYELSWRGLFGIFELPYFSRVWIIQEVAVSKFVEVFCGDSLYCTWDDLVDATNVALSLRLDVLHNTYDSRLLTHINSARGLFQLGIERPLLSVVEQYRSFNASDNRDHVYGLLGLCSQSSLQKLNIVPNYDKSNTVRMVLTELALKELMHSGNLDLLSIPKAIDVPGSNLSLPSWVPDWTKAARYAPFLNIVGSSALEGLEAFINQHSEQGQQSEFPSFAAAGSSRASVSIDHEKLDLRLDGYTVDDVTAVGAMLPDSPNSPSNQGSVSLGDIKTMIVGSFQGVVQNGRTMLDWEELTGANKRGLYKTGESMKDAFWKTFLGGHTIRKGDEWPLERDRWESIAEEYRAPSRFGVSSSSVAYSLAVSASLFSRVVNQAFGNYASKSWPPDLQSPFPTHAHGRRMFRTQSSYIGLGPREMQVGDKVAICSGGKVPLILRACGDGYLFIGDCYVHGLMNGEKYDEKKCRALSIK
ncbi:uncharacterized protein PV09_05493 [Verruconis gallopava]|uniref:Heterokaryon incompatibility domain-containing protein n=1 Tax=Verruconis gallopava TaxID=253628 RepID=A0A0D1YRM6_9PEZI|nr:uncharacterized protein PV09_05493 [Verruconis gallopava]KIW03277.1 hypothetical protein PV09_05493 [Verruconis gallopava]